MKRMLYFLFVISAITFIVSIYIPIQVVANISKPIPLLILIFLVKWKSPYNMLIGSGLIFSLAGDVLLESFRLFVPGLVAFLIAHVFYTAAFIKKSSRTSLLSSLPFLAFAVGMFLFLRPHLGEMILPVAIYIVIISVMFWRSLEQKHIGKEGKYAFLGAALFTLSDSILAINRFYEPVYLSGLWIMASYWGAQFLIFKSTQKQAPA
jgi:alkenylglycerophosphocholine hydrolase